MKDEELIFNNFLYDLEEENCNDDLFKPSKLIYEECIEVIKKKDNNQKKEIKIVNHKKEERPVKEDEFLFTPSKIIYDDKELDNDDQEEDNGEFLLKPNDLIYETPLELFNKRREEGKILRSTKKLVIYNNLKLSESKNIQ